MPHRSNILYCKCEIKPTFGFVAQIEIQKIPFELQMFMEHHDCLFYSFRNAQNVGMGASLTKPSQNCQRGVIESQQSTPDRD